MISNFNILKYIVYVLLYYYLFLLLFFFFAVLLGLWDLSSLTRD